MPRKMLFVLPYKYYYVRVGMENPETILMDNAFICKYNELLYTTIQSEMTECQNTSAELKRKS